MSKDFVPLTEKNIVDIKNLAKEARRRFGKSDNVPIANDIIGLLEDEEIILCEYPFEASEDSHTDASITIYESDGIELTFVGLNTSLCYDEQVFALAHELYHFLTKTGLTYHQNDDSEDKVTEAKADRFAAELLLPSAELELKVVTEFPEGIGKATLLRILRFIARIQCEWWLTYHSIVKRLFEEGHIDKELYNKLFMIDDRDEKSEYSIIFKGLDCDKYELLNKRTRRIGISTRVLEIIIKNFEDGDIDEKEFAEILSLFNKAPKDFGFVPDDDENDSDLDLLY